jgi:hypothetical protein
MKLWTKEERFQGELIGEKNGSYWLMQRSGKIVSVDAGQIEKAAIQICGISENPGSYAWGFVLIPLSITHGYFGAISLPINLLTSISVYTRANTDRQKIVMHHPIPHSTVMAYARFPQGIPATFDPRR